MTIEYSKETLSKMDAEVFSILCACSDDPGLHYAAQRIEELEAEVEQLQEALVERDAELVMLRNALDTIPVHEYGEAQREGCGAKGAWDCFRDALAEHVKAVRNCPAVFAAKERLRGELEPAANALPCGQPREEATDGGT